MRIFPGSHQASWLRGNVLPTIGGQLIALQSRWPAILSPLDGAGRPHDAAGVTATVEEGEVVACERGFDPEASGEASGGIRAWCRTLVDGSTNRLDYSGTNPRQARTLVEGLSEALF